MYRSFVIAIFLFLSFASVAQKKPSIIGKWKIVSFSSGDTYINFKKDSIAIRNSPQEPPVDSLEKHKRLTNARMLFEKIEIEFLADGTFIQRMDSVFMMTAQYKEFPTSNVIELTSKNSFDQLVTDTLKYSIKNGLLSLDWLWDDDSIQLVLERMR